METNNFVFQPVVGAHGQPREGSPYTTTWANPDRVTVLNTRRGYRKRLADARAKTEPSKYIGVYFNGSKWTVHDGPKYVGIYDKREEAERVSIARRRAAGRTTFLKGEGRSGGR